MAKEAQEEDGLFPDSRRFTRVPFSRTVAYRCGENDTGLGSCGNVSRTGLGLRLGRYLRPGRRMVVSFDKTETGAPAEVKAHVVWCRPTAEPDVFEVGIRVFHDTPEVVHVLSDMLHEGLAGMGIPCPLPPAEAETDAGQLIDAGEVLAHAGAA